MIDHIAMVFAAEGLTANEKQLLGAYCYHTDAHGYCWPSVPRLVDETGMSERTVQRTNAALRERGLIKSVHRVNPRTGMQISNLTRVNVPLLASMRRPERDYGDNLIEKITFEDNPDDPDDGTFSQVNRGCQSDTPRGANLTPPPRQIGTPRGANLTPETSVEPSVEPPPPSPPRHTGPASAGAGRGEGEGSPDETTQNAAGPVPSPRTAAEGGHLSAARRLLDDLPAPITPGARAAADLAPAVAAALAAGWTPQALIARLTADLPPTVHSARALLAHRLEDLPPAPPAVPSRPSLPPHCGDPGCRGGWLEDEDRNPVGRCPSWPHQADPATAKEAVR